MAVSKKYLTWIFIALAVIIALLAVWYFFFRDKVEKPTEPVPPGSPTPSWVPESFPLNVGMYGPKIKKLQEALKITPDGKFGTVETKPAIIALGYSVPLSQSDYNTIISSGGGNASSNIKGAYAKYDNTIVRDKNLNEKRKVSKDTYIGTVTGTDNSGSYYEIDGIEYVIKTSTYLKG